MTALRSKETGKRRRCAAGAVTVAAALLLPALFGLQESAFAQSAVGLVTTREASRATGLTGEWFSRPGTIPAPGAWPRANNGQGWGVVGQSPSARLNTTLSSHFEAPGLTTTAQPSPSFKFDVFGNQIYTNASTGRSETFGVTLDRVRR